LIHGGNWGTEAERRALWTQLRRLVADVLRSMAGVPANDRRKGPAP
jgi:hypothetical protein